MCDYPKLILGKLLHSVIPTWWPVDVIRWNDDAITHDNVRACITDLPNIIYPCDISLCTLGNLTMSFEDFN